MLVYYAHSKLIYNTEKEKEEFSVIKDNFKDGVIINPNGWIYDNGKEKDIMEQCYIFVKQSDIIVFSMIEDGFIGRGVYTEIQKAMWWHKKIYCLHEGKLHKFDNFDNISIFERGMNWKRFAKVKIV